MGRVLFLVFLSFLCFFCNLGKSTDILSPGDFITPNGTTLVSSNGNFALGFFRPGNSSSSFLGIWYNHLKDSSVIWVANKESPLLHDQDSQPRFTISDDGNLRLLDGARNTKWSTNLSGPGKTEAQLKDTGNLILKQGNYIVWESFDDGGDTLMPAMRLKVNMRTGKRNILRSWTSNDDPRPGKFSVGLDPTGAPQIFLWKQNVPYFRSNVFQFGFSQHLYVPNLGYSVYFTFGVQIDEVYFSYIYDDDSAPIRFLLSHDGHIQTLFKPKTSNKWQNMLQFQFPGSSECEMYGSCGSFGSCEQIGSSSVCSCLEGFRPKSQKDWKNGNYSGGCVRRIRLECNEDDRFKRFQWIKWPDHPISMANMTFSECEAQCYKNCSCTAFAYTNISFTVNCINWFGDLVDLAHNNSAAISDLHVRVHASEQNGIGGIENSVHKSNSPVHVAVVVVSLAFALFLLIVSVLACILKRKYFTKKDWVMASSRSNASLVGKGDGELVQLSLERILRVRLETRKMTSGKCFLENESFSGKHFPFRCLVAFWKTVFVCLVHFLENE